MWPIIMQLLGLAATGAGAYGTYQNSQNIKKQTGPGSPGTVGYGSEDKSYANDWAPGNDNVADNLNYYQQTVPGGSLDLMNQRAIQEALASQKPYADANIENAGRITPGQAYFHQQLQQSGGPKAISTQTIDQIAAKLSDQNNAQAVTTGKLAQQFSAGSGQDYGNQALQIAANNSTQNREAMRSTDIEAAIANSEFAKQIAGMSAGIDSNQVAMLNAANIDRAGLNQPIDWGHLAELERATKYNNLGLQSGADQAVANMLSSIGPNLIGFGGQAQQARLARQAAGGGGGLGGMLGTLGGAGAGAILGAALAPVTGGMSLMLPLMGAGVGAGIGGSVGNAFGGSGGGGSFNPSMVSNPLMGMAGMYAAANPGLLSLNGGATESYGGYALQPQYQATGAAPGTYNSYDPMNTGFGVRPDAYDAWNPYGRGF